MKEFQVKLNEKEITIIRDDDGKFITPDFIKEQNSYGTTLKPAYEPVVVARKPFKGTLVDNVIKNRVGALNIGECKIGDDQILTNAKGGMKMFRENGHGIKKSEEGINQYHTGRYPANVILTYDETDCDEVCGGFPYTKSGKSVPNYKKSNQDNVVNIMTNIKSGRHYGDEGSAARYFYNAKASTRDRDEGLENFEIKKTGELHNRKEGSRGSLMWSADGTRRINPYAGQGAPKRNVHPSVKPTSLMCYIVRLIAPQGATILDPFMGSGSTGKAVMVENRTRDKGYRFIGIEQEREYCDIAEARIKFAVSNKTVAEDNERVFPKKKDEEKSKEKGEENVQLSLFD